MKKNKEGLTPLSEAIILNNYTLAKYLIENGANANQLDKNGFNTLQHYLIMVD